MKKAILLSVVLAASVVAADDVAKMTTVTTNGQRVVILDAYTRAGVTNLTVKTIVRLDEAKTYRIQNVYRNGKVALEITDLGYGIGYSVKPETDCNVGTHFTAYGALDNVNLMDTNLMTLDHFTVTNGILIPLPSAEIKKGNAIGRDVKELFTDFKTGKADADQFLDRAKGIKGKYQETGSTTNSGRLRSQARESDAGRSVRKMRNE